MLIGDKSKHLLKQTRSKAKMYEYGVPRDLHIEVDDNANELLLIAISAIGKISAEVLNENNPYRIIPADKKAEIEFASHFFDAFLQSKLEPHYPQYYLLLGAIAYYLCDYAGSAKVMANMIKINELDLDCGGIEKILALMLQDKISNDSYTYIDQNASYSHYLTQVIDAYNTWFQQYKPIELSFIKDFRTFIYAHGSPRELLLCDSLLAILLIKVERSALNLLPKYTGLPAYNWVGMLRNKKTYMNFGLHKYVLVKLVFSVVVQRLFKCLLVLVKRLLCLLLFDLLFLEVELIRLLSLCLLGHYAWR